MFNNILTDNILNEAYYGKNQVLLECETLLQDAINHIDIRNSNMKKVQQKLKKLFNFKTLVISSMPVSLGITFPVTTYKFKYIVSKIEMEKDNSTNGIRFKTSEGVEALIFIDIQLMAMTKLTGGEALAIILHEIGHSMRTVLPSSWLMTAIAAISSSFAIFPAIIFNTSASTIVIDTVGKVDQVVSSLGKALFSTYQEVMRRISHIEYIYHTVQKISALAKSKDISFKKLYPNINKAALLTPMKYVQFLSAGLRYKEEALADVISSSYGYGPELSSALAKFKIGMEMVITDNFITRLYGLPINLINVAFDPHPSNVSRMLLIIEQLETDMKTTVDKEAQNLIQEDIDKTKDVLKQYKDKVASSKVRNIDLVIYQKAVDKLLKGHTDFRALFLGLTPNDMKYINGLDHLPVSVADIEKK